MDSEKVVQTFNGLNKWDIAGSYFKLMSTVSPVDVVLRKGGRIVHQAAAVEGGHYQRIAFDSVQITTIANEAVAWLYAPDQGGSDRFTGSFTPTGYPVGQAYTQAAKTATNASAQLLAANASRRYLSIQNQDPTESVYVKCDGTAAAVGNASFKIGPGDVWEPGVPPVGEIRVIRGGASDVSLNVIEA